MAWGAWRQHLRFEKMKRSASYIAQQKYKDTAIHEYWHCWIKFHEDAALRHAVFLKACALLCHK